MKLRILTLLFIIATAPAGKAQDPTLYTKAVSINPLYLKSNGIRINYEQQIKQSRHWFYVSPMLFYGNDTKLSNEVSGNLISYGAEFGGIFKFDEEFEQFGVYTQYGLMLRQTVISYAGIVWSKTIIEDLTYLELKEQNLKKNIVQLGSVATLGYKSKIGNALFIDCYAGLCYRKSLIDFDYPDDNINLDNAPWKLGYTGIGAVVGLTFGTYF